MPMCIQSGLNCEEGEKPFGTVEADEFFLVGQRKGNRSRRGKTNAQWRLQPNVKGAIGVSMTHTGADTSSAEGGVCGETILTMTKRTCT